MKKKLRQKITVETTDPAAGIAQAYILRSVINPLDGPGILEEDLMALEKRHFTVNSDEKQHQ